ncbi:hypothetical protein SAMN05428977_10199 [Nitrosomonas sp. Nm166]|nr:hypothetical protein SAMN05428977_10199 [Nitrosomonas sp. Nm166]
MKYESIYYRRSNEISENIQKDTILNVNASHRFDDIILSGEL